MAESSNIAWTRSTFNGWVGCTKVSPGCDHCYASVSTPARTLGVTWGAGQPRRRTSVANWRGPERWNKLAAEERRLGFAQHTGEDGYVWEYPGFWPVFCSSLADVFDNEVDPAWRADLFKLIGATPNLTWLLLTKRVGNAHQMIGESLIRIAGGTDLLPTWPWPNVWLGATIVDQAEADRDIPKLLAVPAAKRFLSIEPMLGQIEFSNVTRRADGVQQLGRRALEGIDWIIVGGESDQPGMKARPFDIAWARSTVAQCKAAGVPVFMKQAGSFVVDRDDAGFDGCDPYSWPDGTDDKVIHDPFGIVERWQGATIRVKLNDRAGADPDEWPEDLRVREFP